MGRAERVAEQERLRGADTETRAEADAERESRTKVITALVDGLADAPGWRGLEFWRVTTIGGISPLEAARWRLADVVLHSHHIRLRALLDSL